VAEGVRKKRRINILVAPGWVVPWDFFGVAVVDGRLVHEET